MSRLVRMVALVTRSVITIVLCSALCYSVCSGENVHASIMNSLGNATSITVHCKSGDNDLGVITVADGDEWGFDFSPNVWGSTLFFCGVNGWGANVYSFVVYAYDRDWNRCASQCRWLISSEGMYAMNGVTGFWEYFWPAPA